MYDVDWPVTYTDCQVFPFQYDHVVPLGTVPSASKTFCQVLVVKSDFNPKPSDR